MNDDNEADREYQTVEAISELGWAAHRAWSRIIGDIKPVKQWGNLSDDERREVCDLTQWVLDHPTSSIAAQHDMWRAHKISQGKTSQNIASFDELPWSQQRKAHIWRHLVHAIVG